jgi:hypothetical protein
VCETARGARVSRTRTARAVLGCTRDFSDRESHTVTRDLSPRGIGRGFTIQNWRRLRGRLGRRPLQSRSASFG